ncbi:MAG: GlsB/YeaQ/YmgE family stress response membrane protein [Chloroflexota bacterium]
MVLPVVLVMVALVFVIWAAFAVAGLVFSLLPMAIVGLLTGWIAARLTGARLGVGWTLLAGIAGSWVGAALFGVLGIGVGGLLNPLNWIASVLGAAILIAFARAVARPSLTGSSRPRLGRTY